MQKYLIFSLVGSLFFAVGIASAQGEPTDVQAVVNQETITTADLGVTDPGILPTSPLYFLKEWKRGIQRIFTFNRVAKAELELRIANEKAAEVKKVEETKPSDEKALTRALENYEKAQDRLRARLESLRQTSQNPNVDRLLERLAERVVQHEKLFEELEAEHDAAKSVIQNIRAKIVEITRKAAEKDTPEKLKERLEHAFEKAKGSEFKHLRSVEILDRISEKAPEEVKEKLEELREDLVERAQEAVEDALFHEEESKKLKEVVEKLPGDMARRSVLLHEIRERVSEQKGKALDQVLESFEELEEIGADLKEKAAEQIHRAKEKVGDLEEEIADTPGDQVPQSVRSLLREAQADLQSAEKAFEEERYGQAFGRARAGEVAARNGLKILDESELEPGEASEELLELEEKVNRAEERVKARGFTKENQPRLFTLLDNARLHLGFAKDSHAKNDEAGMKLHMGHVDGFLRELFSILEKEIMSKANTSSSSPVSLPSCANDIKEARDFAAGKVCTAIVANLQCPHEKNATYFARNGCEIEYLKTRNWTSLQTQTSAPALPLAPSKTQSPSPSQPQPQPQTQPQTQTQTQTPSLSPDEQLVSSFTLAADDFGFYPSSEIRVKKGTHVKLTFQVRVNTVYYGGLDFRSSKFKTDTVKPGEATTVDFVADETFEFTSWWPASNVQKAVGKVIVE